MFYSGGVTHSVEVAIMTMTQRGNILMLNIEIEIIRKLGGFDDREQTIRNTECIG